MTNAPGNGFSLTIVGLDLVVLLPLATSIVIRFLADPRRQLPWFAGLLAVQALILVTVFAGLNYFTLVWVAPALTLLYWMSTRAVGRLQPGTA